MEHINWNRNVMFLIFKLISFKENLQWLSLITNLKYIVVGVAWQYEVYNFLNSLQYLN